MELSLLRTFAPRSESTMVWNFCSLEHRSPELSSWNFCSLGLSFLGVKVPRTFVPWNRRSLELSLPGAKFQELSLPRQVTFGRDIRSWICMHTQLRPSFNFCCTKALYIRRLPHNHHFQHTTLVSLTTKLS